MQRIIAAGAASLLLAACGGATHIQESATSVAQRDLTLTPSAAVQTEVASKIELATTPTTHRARPTRPAAPIRVKVEPEATPVAVPAPAPEPAAAPAPTPVAVAEAPRPDPTGHELAPGATVTIIPTSAGESNSKGGGSGWSEVPAPRTGGVVTIGGWPRGHCGSGGREGPPISILEFYESDW